MATITLRSVKGSPLTNTEVDSNFSNLNSGKAELTGDTFTGAVTFTTVYLGDNTLTTSSTTGFPYIPAVSGQPTSTPTANTGRAPILWDATNAKLWIYSSGSWNGAGGSGDTAATANTLAQRDGNADIYANNFVSNSDIRLKKNIIPLNNSLDTVLKLQGVSFDMRATDSHQIGFIAQDVEKVVPDLVSTNSETGFKSVNYPVIVSILTEAIKELEARVKELEGK